MKSRCASTPSASVNRGNKQSPGPVLARNSDVSAPRRCSDARRLGERGAKRIVLGGGKDKTPITKTTAAGHMRPTKDTIALFGLSP